MREDPLRWAPFLPAEVQLARATSPLARPSPLALSVRPDTRGVELDFLPAPLTPVQRPLRTRPSGNSLKSSILIFFHSMLKYS